MIPIVHKIHVERDSHHKHNTLGSKMCSEVAVVMLGNAVNRKPRSDGNVKRKQETRK